MAVRVAACKCAHLPSRPLKQAPPLAIGLTRGHRLDLAPSSAGTGPIERPLERTPRPLLMVIHDASVVDSLPRLYTMEAIRFLSNAGLD